MQRHDIPMDANMKFDKNSGELLQNPGRYQRLVEKLYLTVTRLKLMFVFAKLDNSRGKLFDTY